MRAGIAGCGGIAKVHAESILTLKEHTLTGFADINKERAERFARQYGGRAYASLEEMLEKEKLDVLHVCTPHYLHVPMSVLALRKGIHVFQEKPAAISLEQYGELWDAVKGSNALFGLSYQNRYNPCFCKAKEMLDSGETGEVLGGRAFVTWRRGADYYAESPWRGVFSKAGGGCLMNQSVHTLDLLAELIGKPVKVAAKISNHHLKGISEVEDTVEAYITFRSDSGECMGNFYASTAFCTDSVPLIEIVCRKMTLRMEDPVLTILYPNGEAEIPKLEELRKGVGKSYWGSGHKKAIEEFYKSVEQGGKHKLSLENTDLSNRLMFAVYDSAEKRKDINILE